MKGLEVDRERNFIRRDPATEKQVESKRKLMPSDVPEVVLRFRDEARYLAEEWFGIEELLPAEDGSWLVKKAYPENEWLYSFILSLGHHVEVLEPQHLREIIANRAKKIAIIYKNDKAT